MSPKLIIYERMNCFGLITPVGMNLRKTASTVVWICEESSLLDLFLDLSLDYGLTDIFLKIQTGNMGSTHTSILY